LAVAVEQAQTEEVEAEREAYCTLQVTHLMVHLIQFQLEAVAEAAVAAHKTFQVQLEDNLHLMDTLHLAVVSVRDTEETLEAALEDRAEEQDTQEVQDLQVQVNKVQVVLLQDTEIQADQAETLEQEEADQAAQPLLEIQEALENNLILKVQQLHHHKLTMLLEEQAEEDQVPQLLEEAQLQRVVTTKAVAEEATDL
jgi:hypothetical protein